MQNFLTVHSVAEVQRLLCAVPVPTKQPEWASLEIAEGRILAADVIAKSHVPPADRSGMDGYAVRAADLFGATETNPVWLDCIGHVAIDVPADFTVDHGQCAGIATGAHLPAGADAVVMIEHTREFGANVIEMRRASAPGEYVMRCGEDAKTGQTALQRGRLLRSQEIGLLAAVGVTEVPVFPVPVVHILSTGDELVPANAEPKIGQIRDVNSHTLACLVRSCGAKAHQIGIVPDTLQALSKALHDTLQPQEGAAPDVLLISGGSSVGARDLTVTALQNLSGTVAVDIFCHGVALSPGKPLILANVQHRTGHTTVWGLPGQVASAQVVMTILGVPFIRHLAGHGIDRTQAPCPFDQTCWPARQAILARNLSSKPGREDYVRVRLERNEETAGWQAIPVLGLSGLLRTLTAAQGLVRIPAHLEGLEAGSLVEVILFPDQPWVAGR